MGIDKRGQRLDASSSVGEVRSPSTRQRERFRGTSRPLVAFLLVLSLFAPPVGRTRAEPPVAALIGPSQESLRGEPVDLGDPWDRARLLALFGEDARAYNVLRAGSTTGSLGPRAEPFEARLLAQMGMYDLADSLLSLRTHISSPREYYLHWLQRARLCALSGSYERALDFIGRLDGLRDPVFEPYRDLVAVEVLLHMQHPLEVCERAARRLAEGVPLSLRGDFERRLLDAYVESGRLTEALAFIETVKQQPGERPRGAAIVARETDVRFALGDTSGAVRAAFELAKKGRAAEAVDAVEAVIERVPAAKLTDDTILEFAAVLLTKRSGAAEAERLTADLRGRSMERAQDDRRRLLAAEILYAKGLYDAAERELAAPLSEPPLERNAKLLRARVYRAGGDPGRSADAYEKFAAAFPYDAKAPEALYVAYGLRRDLGSVPKASELLRRIVETYPNHKYARWATVRIAVDDAEKKAYARAARVLEQALDRSGRDDPGLLYYLADVYGRMGRQERKAKVLDEIAALNPASFFLDPRIDASFALPVLSDGTAPAGDRETFLGFLERVHREREGAQDRIRSVLEPWVNPSEPGEVAAYLVRGRAFLHMGFRDWAEAELRVVESGEKVPARAYMELAMLYDDFAMPWRSVRVYQRVYYSLGTSERRAFDRDFGVLMYPLPFPSLVFESCLRHGMSPHLAYGMMREESRFDAKAVSGAGAIGLMQIMPETGGQIAEKLGYPKGEGANLFAPEVNVAFGISYASDLLERSDADPLMMLAAYNAGFGNARKWFGKGSAKRSPVERVEGIEFWETRDYVERIVESARLYHDFYFSRPDSSAQSPPR